MSNNSISGANMPSIGNINQGSIQYANNPLQSPQLQSTSLQGSPVQHSPVSQSQVSNKNNQSGDQGSQPLTRPRLQELVREVDPTVQLDEEVEEVLLELADNFLDVAVNASCCLAKHRHASTVELKDKDNGICGYLDSVTTSCGHTKEQRSPKLTNSEWLLSGRL
ncbi:unnamed protein product [Leptidea sinapis]|uniref:Transcription initiation factor TFIID subunit 12 n=1 Tax=Leptidea sinapis TaxID=189913 RepID=A0A5E4PWJ0_9NEOP|nr:unnamed protein product [Leptidea sinapis]